MEPPVRFKASAEKYGFNKEDAIIFKVGEIIPLKKIISDWSYLFALYLNIYIFNKNQLYKLRI